MHKPFVAGVEYSSGREPGGGYLLSPAIGIPEEISGFTTTASPALTLLANNSMCWELVRTKLFPEALGVDVVEGRLSCFPCRHWST